MFVFELSTRLKKRQKKHTHGRQGYSGRKMKQTENTENQQLKLACPLLTEMHKVLHWHHEQQGGQVCVEVWSKNKNLRNHLTLEAENY